MVDPLYRPFYQNLKTSADAEDEDPDLPPEFDVAEELLRGDDNNV